MFDLEVVLRAMLLAAPGGAMAQTNYYGPAFAGMWRSEGLGDEEFR